jgi:hypothetical protein
MASVPGKRRHEGAGRAGPARPPQARRPRALLCAGRAPPPERRSAAGHRRPPLSAAVVPRSSAHGRFRPQGPPAAESRPGAPGPPQAPAEVGALGGSSGEEEEGREACEQGWWEVHRPMPDALLQQGAGAVRRRLTGPEAWPERVALAGGAGAGGQLQERLDAAMSRLEQLRQVAPGRDEAGAARECCAWLTAYGDELERRRRGRTWQQEDGSALAAAAMRALTANGFRFLHSRRRAWRDAYAALLGRLLDWARSIGHKELLAKVRGSPLPSRPPLPSCSPLRPSAAWQRTPS